VLYVGMMNVMLFIPHILIQERFHGAVSGLVVAMAVGTALSWITTACFERFPGMAAPEIVKMFLPAWLAAVVIAVSTGIWISGGVLALYSFTRTMSIFFNPDMNDYVFLALVAFAGVCAGSRSTRSVQFTLEILMIVISPLAFIILYKSLTNASIRWDSIRVVAGYVRTKPTFESVAAATFLFSGYMNITMFNRLNPKGFRIRHKWIIPLISCFFAFTSFFIPIGFHGTMAVDQYMFLWSVTSDSMQMKYGFVQRVLFTFLILFSVLSLMFVMHTFHSGMEFAKSLRPRHLPQTEQWPVPKINWILCGLFAILAFIYTAWANENRNQWAVMVWLVGRFLMEILTALLMILFVWMARKRSRRKAPPSGSAAWGK
jgi:hypothetical protein